MQDANDKIKKTGAATKSDTTVSFGRDVFKTISANNISGYAQMVAYNVLFATAPMLMVITAGAAAITRAVNSDMENPAEPVLTWMQGNLPSETAAFLNEPIERALNSSTGGLLSIGLLLALWGARGAVTAIINGLNMAYGIKKDPRSFVKQNLNAIGLVVLLVLLVGVGGLVFTLGTSLGEDIASAIGLGGIWNRVSNILRWPLVLVIAIVAVATLHLYGPAERKPFRWYLPGAVFTVVGVIVATIALGVWLGNSSGYTETYGIFGSVLAYVFWLYVCGFVVLLGGVINAVVHRRAGDLPESGS